MLAAVQETAMVTGDPPGAVLTERLRLEPLTPDHAGELWLIHNDDAVTPWYQDWRPTPEEATEWATTMAYSWRNFGVHKWIAYHRETGLLVGRGGPSPTPADDDWGRVHQFLPPEPWTRETRTGPGGEVMHANWVEIGWPLLPEWLLANLESLLEEPTPLLDVLRLIECEPSMLGVSAHIITASTKP